MELNNQHLTDTQTIATSTAFRSPMQLLQTVDQWCGANDLTRSQFFRHCITERVKSLGLQPPQASGEEHQWSPELYDRLQRRR
jgi:hypothetical protein